MPGGALARWLWIALRVALWEAMVRLAIRHLWHGRRAHRHLWVTIGWRLAIAWWSHWHLGRHLG